MNYIYSFLLILTLTFWAHSSIAGPHRCTEVFRFQPREYDPVNAFRRAGLDPDQVTLQFLRQPGGEEAPALGIRIFYKGTEIGSMSVWAIESSGKISGSTWKSVDIWRTDTSEMRIRGLGLGQAMYLLIAAKFLNSYPQNKLISFGHSGDAGRMWDALARKGFAKKFGDTPEGLTENFTSDMSFVYEIIPSSIGPRLRNFVRPIPFIKDSNF